MNAPEVLTPVAALAVLGNGLDDLAVGALTDRPLLAVDLGHVDVDDDPDDPGTNLGALTELGRRLRAAPVVVVGVAPRPVALGRAAAALDVVLCDAPAPRPWVTCPAGVEQELADLAASVAAAPGASSVLVQLLRVGEGLDVVDAVVAESGAYGLLQAGPEHQLWLRGRPPGGPGKVVPEVVVRMERTGSTLVVTLDRPTVRNAFGARMRDQLVDALAVADADASMTAVELRGAGPAFCSGGDLAEFGTVADPVAGHLVRTTRNAGLRAAALGPQLRAHVHGACVGAGVELAAFAAEVVARPDATFRLPEVSMGLVPGAGGTVSVPRRIGRHRTAHLALSGRPLDVAGALAWGLVDRVDAASDA